MVKKTALTIGTWNVRTLIDSEEKRIDRPHRRTALIASELKKLDIDIAALSETRFLEQGELEEKASGYKFFWQGLPKGSIRQGGVGFAVKSKLASDADLKPIGVSNRIIHMRCRLTKHRCS